MASKYKCHNCKTTTRIPRKVCSKCGGSINRVFTIKIIKDKRC